jgi:hypothetical protein
MPTSSRHGVLKGIHHNLGKKFPLRLRRGKKGVEVRPQLECVVIGGPAAHPVTYDKEHQPTKAEHGV